MANPGGVTVNFHGDALAAAIVAGMTDAQRKEIIQNAVAAMFAKPEHQGYGEKPKSLIEAAVEAAVKKVAHAIVNDHVENDAELNARLRKSIRTAVTYGVTSDKAMAAMKTKIIGAVESAFGSRYS